MRRGPFRPSHDGFRFANECARPGTAFGLGAPLLPAFGLSAGMVWTALDRFLAGRPVPSDATPPPATNPLHAEFVLRQANALAVAPWTRLVEWQCLPERALPGRPGLAAWSRAQWRRARTSLDAGMPVMLFLVLATGRYANPSSNKAVLAVGYELERGARRVTLRVYDPDRPGDDDVRLVFRTGRSSPLDAHLMAETPVYGFFTVPYDRPIPASLSLETVDGTDLHPVDAAIAVLGSDAPHGSVAILARARGRGGLLRIRRDRRGTWSTDEIAETAGAGIVTEAGAVAFIARNRVLARTATGDLLDVRRSPALGWRVRNVTRSDAVGDAYRLDGNPAVLTGRNTLTVLACGRGKLVRYRRRAARGWTADIVDIDPAGRFPFVGTPALFRLDGLHVLCRTESGDLMHLREDRKDGWKGSSITMRPGGRARFTVADDPIVVNDAAAGILYAIARSADGAVLLFRRTGNRGWRGTDLTFSVRAPGNESPVSASHLSALVDGEGTVHVAGRGLEGGLLHLWSARSGATGGGRVADARRASGDQITIDGAPLLATGPAGTLHIFAHRKSRPLLFRWTPVGGWSLEDVGDERRIADTLQLAGDPVLGRADPTMHIAFGGAGRLHYACVSLGVRERTGAERDARAARGALGRPGTSARAAARHDLIVAVPAGAVDGPKTSSPDAPRLPIPEAWPAPEMNPERAGRAPAPLRRMMPALEGLPLLPEEEIEAPRPAASAAANPPPPPAQPASPDTPRTRSNAQEIQRIMTLGEESPTQVIKPG